jgi:hypothetical protein
MKRAGHSRNCKMYNEFLNTGPDEWNAPKWARERTGTRRWKRYIKSAGHRSLRRHIRINVKGQVNGDNVE